MLKAIYWRLYIIRLSLRWCWKINLRDYVWYKGKKCMALQGVCDPRWDLRDPDGNRIELVHKSEFRKSWTPRNVWRSFCYGYDFYMGYWYSSWVRSGIKPWMRGCNIWSDGRRDK